MNYWDATYDFLRRHGGGPTCIHCGCEMFPTDDHGRFTCLCGAGTFDVVSLGHLPPGSIPQVDANDMADEEKSKIPPIKRLYSKPTAVEAELLSMLIRGPAAMDSSEYLRARKAFERERKW